MNQRRKKDKLPQVPDRRYGPKATLWRQEDEAEEYLKTKQAKGYKLEDTTGRGLSSGGLERGIPITVSNTAHFKTKSPDLKCCRLKKEMVIV